MRVLKKMPAFANVAAGSTALCTLPVGLSYHALIIDYKRGAVDATEAQFGTDFDEVRLNLDGDVKWRLTGNELIAVNKYYGLYDQGFKDGALVMNFSRPWHRTSQGEDFTKIGTADIQTMTLEIDIDAAAVNPTLALYAVQGENAPLGEHVCMRRFAYNTATTGVREIPDLPRGRYAAIALHIGSGNIADVEVEANQRIIFQGPQKVQEVYYEQTDRQWQTGYYHVDFAPTDRLSDALPLMLEDFRLKPNVTVAGAFNIIVERVEKRGGLGA